MVPAEYVFEDDTCDNVIGSRCPRRNLKTKEEMEVAEAPKRNPAKMKGEEPKKGEVQPAVRKRRGRPRKSEKPTAIEGEPQTKEQEATEAAAEAEALQGAGNQLPPVRRGRLRGLGPGGQRDRGRNC